MSLDLKSAAVEFDERWAGERAKALVKYGEDALLPAGRPDYDVFDYMVNELVGMVRYAQMSAERLRLMSKTLEEKNRQRQCREFYSIAKKLEGDAREYAISFIAMREKMKKVWGLMLGQNEQRHG